MTEIRIAVPLIDYKPEAIQLAEPGVDLWEIRQDLIGPAWTSAVKLLHRPWIACNRCPQEGGRGNSDEKVRIHELLKSLEYGASILDIELAAPGLNEVRAAVGGKARLLVSYHNYTDTPPLSFLNRVVEQQLTAGADICKVITTARRIEDNISLLKLIKDHSGVKMVAFAMGPDGQLSRIMAPLAGAYFTFASLETGQESAPGQISLDYMREFYSTLKCNRIEL